ncbi:FixH family protein [Paenibacillus sp. ACRRX]|uniref:FixH family protein n=1 Tax=unclassified Paenibacillus TaxID=185978 RepID=UPI001EF3E10B|nr:MULTISPECIES: FixH family protein [unclassified Paenibacillus]MCG7407175.1 FixH family protein [Paenibacillus sp. ACRRX]MDK8180395.1 FixH family protein [Paenibacillus sp. UMB4589-SE434]
MWKKTALSAMLVLALITGCSNDKGTNSSHEGHSMEMETQATGGQMELIAVELKIPENIKVNEPAVFTAHVTLKEQPINDAEKVEFEWWLEGAEHQKREVSVKADGNYELEQTFDQPGKYTIISHVSANGMHSMPKKSFEVKN